MSWLITLAKFYSSPTLHSDIHLLSFAIFTSSYIGAVIILGLQSDQGTFVTEEIFAPLLTGAVFHLIWILVRSIFNDFISGNRWKSELVHPFLDITYQGNGAGNLRDAGDAEKLVSKIF